MLPICVALALPRQSIHCRCAARSPAADGEGGTQVCTRADAEAVPLPANISFGLRLGGVDKTLYAKSHLAYGLMEVRKRIDDMVMLQAHALSISPLPGVSAVAHPCLLKGDQLPLEAATESQQQLSVTTAYGTGDWDLCLQMMRTLGNDCQNLPVPFPKP